MSGVEAIDLDPYASPDDATVNRAIGDYTRAVREAYGARVKGIYLFGSRARGDHTPDSDADIAVVLADAGGWDFWAEKMRLTDLAYDLLIATGAYLQGWPVMEEEWAAPRPSNNAALMNNMRRDAVPVEFT